MRLTFSHSHVFPGSRVTIEDAAGPEACCLVEFGDGVDVLGEWCSEGADILLGLPPYRTARGTRIEAKRWRLSRGGDGIRRARPAVPG